jgi:hypothetical protein
MIEYNCNYISPSKIKHILMFWALSWELSFSCPPDHGTKYVFKNKNIKPTCQKCAPGFGYESDCSVPLNKVWPYTEDCLDGYGTYVFMEDYERMSLSYNETICVRCPPGLSGFNCIYSALCTDSRITCQNGGTCVENECTCEKHIHGKSCEHIEENYYFDHNIYGLVECQKCELPQYSKASCTYITDSVCSDVPVGMYFDGEKLLNCSTCIHQILNACSYNQDTVCLHKKCSGCGFRGTCNLSHSNDIVCICEDGWSGSRCETQEERDYLSEIVLWTFIGSFTISLLGCIAKMLLYFNVFKRCKYK